MDAIINSIHSLSQSSVAGNIVGHEIISPHASARRIVRLHYEDTSSRIGVYHTIAEENRAFVQFSKTFRDAGLPVPEIFAWDGMYTYIESDFGDITLRDHLEINRETESISASTTELYKASLEWLIEFQIKGMSLIDKSLCYQGDRFDDAAMFADYEKFCAEYAGRVGLGAEAAAATSDFQKLVLHCADYPRGFFMYRDFQSRNIMILKEKPFFIDYQSGREGPLQYDVVSLLFQASARLPADFRIEMLYYYLDVISSKIEIEREEFVDKFYAFAVLRSVQTLGAYGQLGIRDRKQYFLDSIPLAKANLEQIRKKLDLLEELPRLNILLDKIIGEPGS